MKTYSFIATIAIALMLTSCSADSEETYTKPEQVQKFDSFSIYARQGDSLSRGNEDGEPVKPIKRD
ncbi:hypothetical protein G6N05_02150 [Flavobacterium sp. F372]|uniref:Uncharacterized protein n=1 Tax=Flavobacterium bernardetii TaxID=2813823 RepID=A0ABR7IVB7_9FLAO|nr:hypothetical protein [Flavobacterium bernardetii]MBC5833678.1 hypothetical protein [Flavobacterium bernardetii]NHF68911.1 hypothetical protein [Flavobacterium bernardetii]